MKRVVSVFNPVIVVGLSAVCAALSFAGHAAAQSPLLVDVGVTPMVDDPPAVLPKDWQGNSYPDVATYARDQLNNYSYWLGQGRNPGTGLWDGTQGISSSAAKKVNGDLGVELHAVGAVLNSDMAMFGSGSLSNFYGKPATDNSILTRYTFAGDLNLDGVVNADDMNLAVQGFFFQDDSTFGPMIKNWGGGDINYDGVINADDLNTIVQSYFFQNDFPLLTTRPTGSSAGVGATVPEPSTLLLVACGVGVLVTLRLRKRRVELV